MAKNRVVLRSNFPAVRRAMWEAVGVARDKALDAGEDEAENRLGRANSTYGWNLPEDIEQQKTGFQSGLIRFPFFWGKFFEYGTVHLPSVSFMRPAHRKMRSTFVRELGDEAPKWIRRKAGM